MKDTKITFELDGNQRVIIKQDGKEVGHIFSPASSSSNTMNAIQVCGFSEAYDLWGCGIYKGTKDIQLLFDGCMEGEHIQDNIRDWNISEDCPRCFMKKCNCENETELPFQVKRECEIRHRLIIDKLKVFK